MTLSVIFLVGVNNETILEVGSDSKDDAGPDEKVTASHKNSELNEVLQRLYPT